MEYGETDWGYDVLARIVALLCSLATLAEIAAGLADARRRRHILGILSVAEAAAHDFLLGAGAPVSANGHDSADDAIRMAARLRALAILLCVLTAQDARFALDGVATPHADRETPPAITAGSLALSPVPDTS